MATTVVLQGTKISNAVSARTTTSTPTLFTCPANSYALVNIYLQANAGATVSASIGSNEITSIINPAATTSSHSLCTVGPGQSVTTNVSGGSGVIAITGVTFINF